MKNQHWIYFIFLFVFIGCDKEDGIEQNDTVNYFPLAVGNYWTYDIYMIENGTESLVSHDNTFSITGDSLINGNLFYMLDGEDFYGKRKIELLRDSAGFIINPSGRKLLSFTNFTDTLFRYDIGFKEQIVSPGDMNTLYTMTYKMEMSGIMSFPIGSFDAINCRGTLSFNEKYRNPDLPNPRYVNAYYINGIGKALETQTFLNSEVFFERRLVKYHVKP